ncbi:phage major tail tube protein [Enterobacter roggenkampii]|uniref:phage major tail tube protein n=1 Tax=Enterobacter roggenkampii TaxID=1812935 RepID=UPI00223788E4|nr:phage major tail tube protein [Enterobacter roggenkampii]MCW5003541.1 phage major tail tube protein [Enterobacter roggenkampii]
MSFKNYLRGWTLFIDGLHRLEGAVEYSPPELAIALLSLRTGGMDAPVPVDDGMEALTVSFKIYGVDADVLSRFGMQPGRSVRLTAYEAFVMKGIERGKVDEMTGIISRISHDARPNSNLGEAGMSVEMGLSYYRSRLDGRELIEIIPESLIRRINGVNVLAGLRAALRV